MKLEIKYEGDSTPITHSVVRRKPNRDYVLDVKPRIYIEMESPSWGHEGIAYKDRDGTYHWQPCYIKTTKGYKMGVVRRVEE